MPSKNRKIPPPPAGFDPNLFFKDVFWFQRWELFAGVFTPGHNPIEDIFNSFGIPNDLTGKRVLDIGAWNGCMSFECERRNAKEVVSLSPEDPEITGYNRIKKILRSTRTRYVRGSTYDLDPAKLGYFDLVLFCGVLYHLRYPLLAIDNIRRVATDTVYVETVLMDKQISAYQASQPDEPESFAALNHVPLWVFFRWDELEKDPSNWFGPNVVAVIQAFQSAGFDIHQMGTQGGRGTFQAVVQAKPPEFLSESTLEGIHYKQIMAPLMSHRRLSVRIEDKLGSILPSSLLHRFAKMRFPWGNKIPNHLLWKDYTPVAWRRKVHRRIVRTRRDKAPQ